MPANPIVRLVLPGLVERSWVVQRLLAIGLSRWGTRMETWRDTMDLSVRTKPELLLSASFVLHDDPPWQYFCDLATSGRAVLLEELDSGLILAAAFPPHMAPVIVRAWVRYLSFASAGEPAERPPLPAGCWVLHESGHISTRQFAARTHYMDDLRRARNLPAINQLVLELSSFSDEPLLKELAAKRGSSLVPWLHNTLLNEAEYRSRAVQLVSSPREMHISTTSACNIECRFCSYTHQNAIFRYLDLQSFLRLDVYSSIENLRLSSGLGEPSLNPHLPAILAYLGTHYPHLNVNVFTNGLAWRRPELLEAFRHLSWINISLNAATADTWKDLCLKDGFGRVRDNLALLRKVKGDWDRALPRLHASTVLNTRNVAELADLPYLCAEAGIVRLTAIPFFALGYGGMRKLDGAASLDACRSQYAEVLDRTVRAAEQAGVTLEAPAPGPTPRVAFGLEERRVYDFGKLARAEIQIERLLSGTMCGPAACPSLWRLGAIAATSLSNRRHDVHGYLYPCLGPLASHDFSAEMPIDFSSRSQFMDTWNGPRYRRLRGGQTERGLSPTCDDCGESDSRNPRNFELLLRLRSEAAVEQLVQLESPIAYRIGTTPHSGQGDLSSG